MEATDFSVNGIAADSVTLIDSDTLTFTFTSTPVTGQGLQSMHMDGGAVARASDGLALAVYDANFRYDNPRLAVTTTDPAAGGVLTMQGLPSAATAVASMAGMKGFNGGWPVLYGAGAVGASGLKLAIDEDNLFDTERSHANEQVAFLALDGVPSGEVAPFLRTGTATANSSTWTTVPLGRSYSSMVVVVTPNYSNTTPPLVARVKNAAGNSFQVKVDRVDGQSAAVSGVGVHYVVVEEGVYTLATHGVKMEAVKFTSTVTDQGSAEDGSSSWVGESRPYAQPYASPVVLGQVMTAADPSFSVFWARGADATAVPSGSALYVGKHVGEDPNPVRANETIGYIVIEGGLGTMGGTSYMAGVGANTVQGMDNAPPFTYGLTLANLRVDLNEPVAPGSVGVSDLTLNCGAVMSASAVDADTIEYVLVNVPRDVTLAVALAAGALTDVHGNPMLPFSAAYYVGPTKFYVVNDDASDRTYEYGSGGGSVESYVLNSGNTAPRGAAASAAGDKVWVLDANRNVYVYNTGGGLLGSWTPGGLKPSAQVEGITTNGTDAWLLDNKQDRVYMYPGVARLLSGFQTPNSNFSLNSGNGNGKGIVTDGTSLWVVDDGSTTDKVFKYTLSGALLGSWTITGGGGSPTGITLDPTAPAHLWIVDSGTDRVYQYDNAVGRTSGSQSASATFALAAGNTNPQDIADPPPADMALTPAAPPGALQQMPATGLPTAAKGGVPITLSLPSLAERDVAFAVLAWESVHPSGGPWSNLLAGAALAPFLGVPARVEAFIPGGQGSANQPAPLARGNGQRFRSVNSPSSLVDGSLADEEPLTPALGTDLPSTGPGDDALAE